MTSIITSITRILTIAGFSMAAIGGAQAQSTRMPIKSLDPPFTASLVPDSAFYLGGGGSATAVNFGNQNVFAVGTSDVTLNGALVNSGAAAGPATITMPAQNGLAPMVQGGFFQRFNGTDWLWGAKFTYSYLDTTASVQNALLPQTGAFRNVNTGVVTPFTGNAVVRSFQTNVDHQIALVPFVGQAFARSFVYLGAGPTASHTRTNLNGLVGFADVTGVPSDVSGLPVNMSSAGWVYGGIAVVGMTYFLDRNWFVDFNYSYARSATRTANFSTPFTNPNGVNGTVNTGTMIGRSSQVLTNQAATISINRTFALR